MADTLWSLRGQVKEVKPNASQDAIDGWINKRIRNVIEKRTWSDLLRMTVVAVPDAYTTGTVTVTHGSALVAGASTVWPTNDTVNVTLDQPIMETGYVEHITPTAMTGIAIGSRLLLDAAHPAITEVITVVAKDATSFTAQVLYQHDAGVALTQSSLVGRQFKAGNYYPYTVKSVRSATSLELDAVYAGPAASAIDYEIYLGFLQISATARRLRYAWDPVQGFSLGVDKTIDYINLGDPQRTATGDPQELVQMPPDRAGIMQWEIWPHQTSKRAIGVVYGDGWPKLVNDSDMTPPFLNEQIFISGACADALRTKSIPRDGRQDPYYDPQVALSFEEEFKSLVEDAVQSDQGRYQQALQNWMDQVKGLTTSFNWQRSHLPMDLWP